MPLSVDSPAPLSTTVPPSRKARVRMRNEAGATFRSVQPGAVYVTHPWCRVRPGGRSTGRPWPAARPANQLRLVKALYLSLLCPRVHEPGFMCNLGGFVRKSRTIGLAMGASALAAAVVV